MIIYTNEGNPQALKLLICAKTAKKEVTLKIVSLNDPAIKEPKHLPVLELDSGNQIFLSDAAAKFLLSDIKEDATAINQWLEWSSTLLAPALALNAATKVAADSKQALTSLVQHLNETLKKSPYLCGSKESVADYAVFSIFAPEGSLKGLQGIENVLKWQKNIESLPAVQAALQEIPAKSLNFISLQHSNRFGGILESINSVSNSQATVEAAVVDIVSAEEIKLAKDSFVFKAVPKNVSKAPKTVLPKQGEQNILITSALPYVNNVPHLGNIIGCVLSADIFARFSRLCGHNTLYICGTDEYGTATETKALAENLTPKQICDKYFELHNGIYRWFGIGFDYFGRTTTPEQTEIVQEMFLALNKKGLIETNAVDQLLCQKCDRYLADRFVEGTCPFEGCGFEDARGDQCDGCGKLINAIELIKPRCQVCRTTPVVRESKQFFLDLPKIEPKLKEWIKTVEDGWTSNAKIITRSWLRDGLHSRCITRDLKWGIPVPLKGYEDKVFYVWFDAPIGYMSITSRYTKEWRQWWQPKDPKTKVNLYQFMAKDNVPFHSVMFPSTLIGVDSGYTIVSHIMATEYLNYEDGKFSKSRGIGVFGNDAQDTGIEADVWRFYLASARPEGQDSSFSWSDLATRNNSELLNNLGNFVNRALVFCEKNYDSTMPEIGSSSLTDEDFKLLALINREVKNYVLSMQKTRFRDAIKHILTVSRNGNQYMQIEQPWVLLKGTDEQKVRAGLVIAMSCNISCLLATLLFPFMPDTARKLYKQLNIEQGFIDPEKPQLTLTLQAGHKINKPIPLFTKIEMAHIEELKKKYGGTQEQNTKGAKPEKSNILFDTAAEAQKAVDEQGMKVRDLKASGAEKAVWQPEVTILQALKSQLVGMLSNKKTEIAKPASVENKPANQQTAGPADIKILEEEIAKQAEKVRVLKTSGGDKAVWQPEVTILLALKAKLTALTGIAPAPPSGKSKKKK